MEPTTSTSTRDLVVATLPVAAAIGVFGVIYGAAGRPVLGPELTIVSSLLVFSGAAQFSLLALLVAGASTVAVVGASVTLALRHLPLGAVLRPGLAGVRRGRRALLSLGLVDETTGLALTRPGSEGRTLAVSGVLAYVAWVAGTVAGVLGASLTTIEPLAGALFPVLFVGLAALTSRTRADGGRALLAGAASLLVLVVVPDAGALAAIGVAVVVAVLVPAP
jgi:predicted branched-subunit amino acid permease